MEKETSRFIGVPGNSPVYLVAGKGKTRSKIRALDVLWSLFLLLTGACLLVGLLAQCDWDFGSIFDVSLSTHLLITFVADVVFVVLGLICLILGACGKRTGVSALFHFWAFALCVYAAVQVTEGLTWSSIDASSASVLVYGALFALGAFFCLIAFFVSLCSKPRLGTAVFRTVMLALGLIPSLAYWGSTLIADVALSMHLFLNFEMGFNDMLHTLLHSAALVFGILFVGDAAGAFALRLVDRGANVDTLRSEAITRVVTADGTYIAAEPAPRKRVIWVGRTRR